VQYLRKLLETHKRWRW